jgi:hypothetical protein
MAHKSYKAATFRIDNASATLGATTILTGSVNQASIAGVMSILEDSGLGDSARTYLPGLSGATITINGFSNSTTDGIFGPLVGNRTSITKTVEFDNGDRKYNGEVWPTNVTISGSVDSVTTWSCDLTFDGAVNRTSVSL